MFEVVFAVAMLCGPPAPPPDHVLRGMLNGDIPMNVSTSEVFGQGNPDLPVTPTTSIDVSYGVWVEPGYDLGCFESKVDEVLLDDRSWPHLRPAGLGETPQFWVTLVPTGAACGSWKSSQASCAFNNGDGTGEVRINYLRWTRGYGSVLPDARTMLLNHEVGHIYGIDHYDCSVMSHPEWVSEAGWPKWDTGSTCDPVEWPTVSERATAWNIYASRWLLP